ncbi:uncharacterized protein LOC113340643 [Papaver somniferum]|uniref:uncharacterized protein LOC113340643 n=1 Tax=Papaver somniferum TaxID=3469 RepID=UPI000E6FC7A4|nr:uncharacterized protein LOC113340643 [Papaver somniferum]
MGPNLFVFKFSTDKEQIEIMKKAPWTVKGYLLAMEIYNPKVPLADAKIIYQNWTVKFRNLQLEHLNVSLIDEIIQDLGEKFAIDPPNAHPRISIMVKARIQMNLTSPVKRGAWLRTTSRGEAWVKYHWEKKPYHICDQCWMVNHSDDNCEKVALQQQLDSMSQRSMKYGVWNKKIMKWKLLLMVIRVPLCRIQVPI